MRSHARIPGFFRLIYLDLVYQWRQIAEELRSDRKGQRNFFTAHVEVPKRLTASIE